MRKISKKAAIAFLKEGNYTNGNTKVATCVASNLLPYTITEMYLHGNTIATLKGDKLTLTCAGWATPTTKERLNTLMSEMGIVNYYHTKKGQLYFFDEPTDDDEDVIISLASGEYGKRIA